MSTQAERVCHVFGIDHSWIFRHGLTPAAEIELDAAIEEKLVDKDIRFGVKFDGRNRGGNCVDWR